MESLAVLHAGRAFDDRQQHVRTHAASPSDRTQELAISRQPRCRSASGRPVHGPGRRQASSYRTVDVRPRTSHATACRRRTPRGHAPRSLGGPASRVPADLPPGRVTHQSGHQTPSPQSPPSPGKIPLRTRPAVARQPCGGRALTAFCRNQAGSGKTGQKCPAADGGIRPLNGNNVSDGSKFRACHSPSLDVKDPRRSRTKTPTFCGNPESWASRSDECPNGPLIWSGQGLPGCHERPQIGLIKAKAGRVEPLRTCLQNTKLS